MLFAKRSGWMNAQQMGTHLLERARGAGVELLSPAAATGFETNGAGRVSAVVVRTAEGARALPCSAVVNCAGPFASAVNELLLASGGGGGSQLRLPLRNEVHAKAMLRDDLRAVPPTAPMMIWNDEVALPWSEEERGTLGSMGGFEASLAAPLPAGVHFRPYPGEPGTLLLLWEALHSDLHVAEPPPAEPELRGATFVELMLRGLRPMVPRLANYLAADGSLVAHVAVDGGYYTACPDNMPLVGPVPGAPENAFVCAGASGYGVMAANGAGELLARHVAGTPLPEAYASHFLPARWLDSAYRDAVASGQVGKGLQI